MTQTAHLALVAGGSAGIGLELARQAATHGYDVIITGASDRVHAAARDLAESTHAEVVAVQSDLRTPDGVDEGWAAVQRTGRPLTVAMINAGVAIGGAFVENDLRDEVGAIELNVLAPVRLAKPIARDMLRRGTGRIMFTTSVSATTPTPFETIYGPSRAFVYSFSHSLREELRGSGVTVTALLPGATATEFHARAGMSTTRFGDNSWKNDPALVARLGFEAMLAGRDHVIGGGASTRRAALINKFLPERVKAARHARAARPGSGTHEQ